MKKALFLLPLIFFGCSFTQTSKKVTTFAKCYVKNIPAPFWICYQSPFISVGKLHTKKVDRLKQEEAYAKGVNELTKKLTLKTEEFLAKIGYKKKDILNEVKNFVILNAIETNTWFNKEMLYVEVEIDKKEFKKFLFSRLKNYKNLEEKFDESF